MSAKRMDFYDWIMKKYKGSDTAFGDLAYDMTRDDDFPRNATYEQIEDHLIMRLVPSECWETFDDAWKEYRQDMSSGVKVVCALTKIKPGTERERDYYA